MQRVRAGVEVDGKLVVPHEFRIMRETANGILLSVVVHEGMNRVVRRMMEFAEIPVTKLSRSRIGPLSIAGIPRGAHRDLTEGELTSLFQALHLDRDPAGPTQPVVTARSAHRQTDRQTSTTSRGQNRGAGTRQSGSRTP